MFHKNLIIACHPDDETIGCFSQLDNSLVLFLTDCGQERQKMTKEVFENQGFNIAWQFLNLCPALELDKLGVSAIIKAITEAIGEIHFEYVYSHYSGDLHQDHQITAKAMDIFCRPSRNPEIKGYFQYFTDFSFPLDNLMVKKVSEQSKIRALNAYGISKTHMDFILDFNKMIGSKFGFKGLAEPFLVKFLK